MLARYCLFVYSALHRVYIATLSAPPTPTPLLLANLSANRGTACSTLWSPALSTVSEGPPIAAAPRRETLSLSYWFRGSHLRPLAVQQRHFI
jgi:hypothetical protein